MNVNDRIYIPRKPRLGLDRPNYHWRRLGWLFLACALVSAVIGWFA